MSVRESIASMVHLVNTAELPKATAQILETKLSLLTEQTTALENEISRLKDDNERLRIRVKCLEPQNEEISPETVAVLKLFFERASDLTPQDISAALNWKQSVADYHIEVLLKKRFIRETSLGMQTALGASVVKYGLTTLGRRYAVQYVAL